MAGWWRNGFVWGDLWYSLGHCIHGDIYRVCFMCQSGFLKAWKNSKFKGFTQVLPWQGKEAVSRTDLLQDPLPSIHFFQLISASFYHLAHQLGWSPETPSVGMLPCRVRVQKGESELSPKWAWMCSFPVLVCACDRCFKFPIMISCNQVNPSSPKQFLSDVLS